MNSKKIKLNDVSVKDYLIKMTDLTNQILQYEILEPIITYNELIKLNVVKEYVALRLERDDVYYNYSNKTKF